MADATFSVLLLTAAPTSQGAEAGGAFVKVDGRECLLRSIELFLNRDAIKQIQMVFDPEVVEEAKRKHGPHLSFSGVKVLSGGPCWMDQIAAAAGTIMDGVTHVLVHDAARPAVPYTDIEALMAGTKEMKLPATFLTSTIRNPLIEVDEHGHAKAYHPAEKYLNLMTPMMMTAGRFNEMAKSRGEVRADEATILKGSPLNVRCAGPGDAVLLKTMLGLLPKPKKNPLSNPFEEAQW